MERRDSIRFNTIIEPTAKLLLKIQQFTERLIKLILISLAQRKEYIREAEESTPISQLVTHQNIPSAALPVYD